jgi:hypothetical protein
MGYAAGSGGQRFRYSASALDEDQWYFHVLTVLSPTTSIGWDVSVPQNNPDMKMKRKATVKFCEHSSETARRTLDVMQYELKGVSCSNVSVCHDEPNSDSLSKIQYEYKKSNKCMYRECLFSFRDASVARCII